jgi:hypothetical protein
MTDDPESERWKEIHARSREAYRLPPDIGTSGLDLNAPSTSSDKVFTVREAEMRVIAAAMDWASEWGNSEIEDMALEMGITLCLADLAKSYELSDSTSHPPAGGA